MNKWIAEFELEDGDTMPEHMDLEYKGAKIDFHCRPMLPKDDAVEIVLCKDCKHLFDGEHNANCCEVLMKKAKWLTEITVDMNWHCADGERREDDN